MRSDRSEESRGLATVRRLLLALVIFGSVGLLAELFLLEHYEAAVQWVPVALLALGILSGVALWVRPNRRTVRLFRWLMGGLVLASLVGIVLHFGSNAAFEKEMDPAIGGLALVWYALRGATPALAPGALAQLGIIGLILVYRHPALGAEGGDHPVP